MDPAKKIFFQKNKHKQELKDLYHPTNLEVIIQRYKAEEGNRLTPPEGDLDLDLLEQRASRDMLQEIVRSDFRKLYHQMKKSFKCNSCEKTFGTRDGVKDHLNDDHTDSIMGLTFAVRENLYYINFMNDEKAVYQQNLVEESSPDMIGWIQCESEEMAFKIKEELSKLPQNYFLKCYSPCNVDGKEGLAVEKHRMAHYPLPNHLRNTAIRHLINLAIYLELKSTVHASLSRETLVEVNHKPKHYCTPIKLYNFEALVDAMDNQQIQLCELTDYVVGETELQDPTYQNFRECFLNSKTLVDLQSLLFHPYISEPSELPYYNGKCHIILACTTGNLNCTSRKLNHLSLFNKKFGNENGFRLWTSTVKGCEKETFKNMLNNRMVNGRKLDYVETPFDNHKYFFNVTRHANDDVPEAERYNSVDEIHAELEKLFPGYILEMFNHCHETSMNAHFGPEDYALRILKYAQQINEQKDNSFSVSNIIATCRMIYYMLAKFRSLCEDKEARLTVDNLAKVLEDTIQTLETFEEKHIKCSLCNINRGEDMSDKEKVLLTSVCLVYGALLVVYNVIENNSTNYSIVNAVTDTLMEFRQFDNTMMHEYQKLLSKLPSIQWPDIKGLQKIVGENFILQEISRAGFFKDLNDLCKSLIKMLKA